MKNISYDLIVIGGGHAGLEAACIAASYSELSVAIITAPDSSIASAPCNPAIGGVGKGQVVREIDALGGVMGKLADKAGIQFRTLNESKGYAVQSTRIQVDKELYTKNAEELVESYSNIAVIREMVESVDTGDAENKDFRFQVKTKSTKYLSRKIIVTTGTFLGGKLHTGKNVRSGGRVDCESSAGLKDLFSNIKTLGVKFKTGTPPRLSKTSLDYSKLEVQPSDISTPCFHFNHKYNERISTQVDCYLTRTNNKTLDIIRENKEQSPIFNGQITGKGPRYCPSIEDKAFRYEDKNIHHVFIEPEGLNLDTIYPNGISTSLPASVQRDFIRTIDGLEKAEILVDGYAVEYDVVDTSRLNNCLEYSECPGLYFAGQVNGTSGYEEAAGQGLIAGANAAFAILKMPPLVISRNESYIGVMIDDLVSSVRDEPYRLFTARSENRLFIREDNAYTRMAKYRSQFCLLAGIDTFHFNRSVELEILFKLVDEKKYQANEDTKKYFEAHSYGPLIDGLSLKDLLKRSSIDPIDVLVQECKIFDFDFTYPVIREVAISTKYSGYINRSLVENARVLKVQSKKISWENIINSENVSYECKQRIERIRPETFLQLQKIDGIRPATLAYVAGNIVN